MSIIERAIKKLGHVETGDEPVDGLQVDEQDMDADGAGPAVDDKLLAELEQQLDSELESGEEDIFAADDETPPPADPVASPMETSTETSNLNAGAGTAAAASSSARRSARTRRPPRPTNRPRAATPTESKPVVLNTRFLDTQGMLTQRRARGELAEEYRFIKRPLLLNIDRNMQQGVIGPNLIMVTSAVPDEGKTVTSINLAMSISLERDHTVLLIDTDVNRSSISEYLGVAPQRGLLDVLEDPDTDIASVMLRTDVEKLSIVPAGRASTGASELIGSDAMADLLEELSERYDDRIIIIDTPPVLATSGASMLAGMVGQVVMVVAANSTSESDIKEALAQLDTAHSIGLVLNKTSRSQSRGSYGYSYNRDLPDAQED